MAKSDEKKQKKEEKRAKKAAAAREAIATDLQFKDYDKDKVVVAELDFDDDDVKKSQFVAPFDASKTSLTREEWDAAIGEVNGVFHHKGLMALLCCLCGEPEHHVEDLQKKCKALTEKYESRGVAFYCVHKEDVAGLVAGGVGPPRVRRFRPAVS